MPTLSPNTSFKKHMSVVSACLMLLETLVSTNLQGKSPSPMRWFVIFVSKRGVQLTSGSHEMIHPWGSHFKGHFSKKLKDSSNYNPPQAPWLNLVPAWWDLYHPGFWDGQGTLPQKQLTTWKVFAGQIGCNSDVCYLRSMLEFHKRSCTQHVFNHPTTIYLLQVPLGWKHPKIPSLLFLWPKQNNAHWI